MLKASATFHVRQDQTRREFENQLIQLRAHLSNTFRVFVGVRGPMLCPGQEVQQGSMSIPEQREILLSKAVRDFTL